MNLYSLFFSLPMFGAFLKVVVNSQSSFDGSFMPLVFLSSYVMMFSMITVVLYTVSLWKIFSDNDIEGWKALIPIYNIYLLLEIVNLSGWWLLLYFFGFGYITSVLINYRLTKNYNKILIFLIGLEVLPFVFYPILAFSEKKQKNNNLYDNSEYDL